MVADFPLTTSCGVYTERARAHFLARRAELGSGIWPFVDLKAASELAGICAFDDPHAALKWASASPEPAEFVEFDGEYVCPAPDDPSAVVVRFAQQVGEIMTEAEFRERYTLPND